MDSILHYCPKCGRMVICGGVDGEAICDCCEHEVYPIPEEFLEGRFFIKDEKKQQFIEEYIKPSPEFDQYLFDHRDEILDKQNAEYEAQMARGRAILEEQSCRPECPTCHSKNVQRISGMERGLSIYVFGIFSNKFNKTFKCNHCGYTW